MIALNKKTLTPVEKPHESAGETSIVLQIMNRYLKWIVVLVVFVVTVLCYMLLTSAQIANVRNEAEKNLPAKESVYKALQKIQKEVDIVVLEYENLKRFKKNEIEKLSYVLPERRTYSELYSMLDDLTRSQGLTLKSLTVGFADTPQTAQGQSATQQQGQAPAGAVKTMTLNLSVSGGNYEIFKKYLDALERSIRLFDIRSLAFNGSAFISATGPGSVQDAVNVAGAEYTIELITYYTDDTND